MVSSADHPIVEFTQSNRTPLYVSLRGPLEVGRECDGVLLADPQVSRRHLLLDVAPDGDVIATDLGSTNGSTMNGVALRNPTPLRVGSIIRCGETTIRLEPPPSSGRSNVVSSQPAAGPATVVPRPITDPVPGNTADPVSDPVSDLVPDPRRDPMLDPVRDPVPDAPAPEPPVPHDPGAEPPNRWRRTGDDLRRTSIDIVAASAANDGVDIEALPSDQGTVTIVFSDIEESTARNVALGDQVWFEVLADHNTIVTDRVREHGGTVVKHQGDGFMLSFPGARRALDCMAAVQRDLTAHARARPERKVRIRIGLHTGEVLTDDAGDLFGRHVVVAARVADLAEGGEILVSSLTREIIASRGDVVFGEPRSVMLKGIGDAVVHPIEWARMALSGQRARSSS